MKYIWHPMAPTLILWSGIALGFIFGERDPYASPYWFWVVFATIIPAATVGLFALYTKRYKLYRWTQIVTLIGTVIASIIWVNTNI